MNQVVTISSDAAAMLNEQILLWKERRCKFVMEERADAHYTIIGGQLDTKPYNTILTDNRRTECLLRTSVSADVSSVLLCVFTLTLIHIR